MRFTTLLLAIFPAALMASPVETNARDVAARDFPGVAVRMWSGDVCDGEVEPVNIVGHGAYRCVAVTNKRSIVKITERPGCKVTTWSGSNCQGSSYELAEDDAYCHSILYASVSIDCP